MSLGIALGTSTCQLLGSWVCGFRAQGESVRTMAKLLENYKSNLFC